MIDDVAEIVVEGRFDPGQQSDIAGKVQVRDLHRSDGPVQRVAQVHAADGCAAGLRMRVRSIRAHGHVDGHRDLPAPSLQQQAGGREFGIGNGVDPRAERFAPSSQLDLFHTIPELFNLCDKYQCPGLVLSDLLIGEGTSSIDPADLDFDVKIERGELILPNGNGDVANHSSGYNDSSYLRFKNTESGISPRAVPGVPGHIFVAATDEHDEDGTIISDEFTNPHKRRLMVEKRARKMEGLAQAVPPPKLVGPESAAITLVGWGSTQAVIREAVEKLAGEAVIDDLYGRQADLTANVAGQAGDLPAEEALARWIDARATSRSTQVAAGRSSRIRPASTVTGTTTARSTAGCVSRACSTSPPAWRSNACPGRARVCQIPLALASTWLMNRLTWR